MTNLLICSKLMGVKRGTVQSCAGTTGKFTYRNKSNNIRIPTRLGLFTLTGLAPAPRRSQSEGQMESDIAFLSFRIAVFFLTAEFPCSGAIPPVSALSASALTASPPYFSPPTTNR